MGCGQVMQWLCKVLAVEPKGCSSLVLSSQDSVLLLRAGFWEISQLHSLSLGCSGPVSGIFSITSLGLRLLRAGFYDFFDCTLEFIWLRAGFPGFKFQ